ncbi:chaperone protein dnaJ 11, chloroplastic-like [Impatiens glandulifera]|uniref:chaperone protein dnaJ 11, chloroplastic-like n=1 Tax=Impatiens glandulifera TaxID=253017 RepID=UPI001FB0BAC9|nr:chaperone protein dnaJ 11, chloroplastic-like [Impatiens glandulifera]
MIGTLAFPSAISLRPSSDCLSTPNNRKMSCQSSIHTFADTIPVTAESRKPSSLYDVLKVNRSASPIEIKYAYRTLAKVYHPDASESVADGRNFIEIRNAYTTLSDPTAREMYDMSLSIGSGRRYSSVTQSRYKTSRRWETDQCW